MTGILNRLSGFILPGGSRGAVTGEKKTWDCGCFCCFFYWGVWQFMGWCCIGGQRKSDKQENRKKAGTYGGTLRRDRRCDETFRGGSRTEKGGSYSGEREGLRYCGKQRFRKDGSYEVYLRFSAASLPVRSGYLEKGSVWTGISRNLLA